MCILVPAESLRDRWIVRLDLDSGTLIRLADGIPIGVLGEELLFNRGSTLLAAPLGPSAELLGPTRSLESRLQLNYPGEAQVTTSRAGVLVYLPLPETNLVRVNRSGTVVDTLTPVAGSVAELAVAPSGDKVAYAARAPQSMVWDVHTLDLTRRDPILISRGVDSGCWGPAYTLDARAVAVNATHGLLRIDLESSNQAKVLLEFDRGRDSTLGGWSRDGKRLAYSLEQADSAFDVHVLDVRDGKVRTVVSREGTDQAGPFSPDDSWLSYSSDYGDGAFNVWLRSLDGTGREYQVSTDGGWSPVWSPDGSKLFYGKSSGAVYEVDTSELETRGPAAPELLFRGDFFIPYRDCLCSRTAIS